jgi:hypothetical protein
MYANRRYDEFRQILKILARKNRINISDDKIDSIVFEFENRESE